MWNEITSDFSLIFAEKPKIIFFERGLFTPKCRSPPFLCSKTKIREQKKGKW